MEKTGARVILGDDHAQAVLQLGIGEFDLLDWGGSEMRAPSTSSEGRDPAKCDFIRPPIRLRIRPSIQEQDQRLSLGARILTPGEWTVIPPSTWSPLARQQPDDDSHADFPDDNILIITEDQEGLAIISVNTEVPAQKTSMPPPACRADSVELTLSSGPSITATLSLVHPGPPRRLRREARPSPAA